MAETLRSATSFERQMPLLRREIVVTAELDTAEVRARFDSVRVVSSPRHAHRPKFEAMLECELDQALFIDGDTWLVEPIDELFDVLAQFDVALAPAPQYLHPKAAALGVYERLPPVSTALPEWNGGVLLAHISDRFRRFVLRWSELFELCQHTGFAMDQPSLRAALAHSDLRIANLPVNYNFRANLPQMVKGRVKILHAHGELERIASYVNRSEALRHYQPVAAEIHGFQPR